MAEIDRSIDANEFVSRLFDKLKQVCPAIDELELYEFCYALDNLSPPDGWGAVERVDQDEIARMVNDPEFYSNIQTKLKVSGMVVIDQAIIGLTQTLFTGLVSGSYSTRWVSEHFYFDVRSFFFFHRTKYFTDEITDHFGGKPYRSFEPKQKRFERFQGVGYKDFKDANAEIDQSFINSIVKLIEVRGTPILLTLAGPTAAGKTEIIERLMIAFARIGKKITTIEMDNFLLDRDIRGEQSMGDGTHHFQMFRNCLQEILQGKKITIPRYDFVNATSSHAPNGSLKPEGVPIEVEPADIIFIEGNFPFQKKEIADLIGIKVVYLTDDSIRLKRKWKRDIDYRKKYDPNFFVNRYFKTQFLRAEECYLQQMKVCDMVVDTTGAALWVTPEIAELIQPV